jgi:membrane fusion protein, heavy metal efflux system
VTTISPAPTGSPTRRRTRGKLWKLALGALALAGLGLAGTAYFGKISLARVREALYATTAGASSSEPVSGSTTSPEPPSPPERWDGLIKVAQVDQEAIGIGFHKVQTQTSPMKLELNGHTAYVPDTITKVRPRFDTKIEKVLASLGQRIKKGDPLVQLYSTDLADAKTAFQTKYVQWQHDLKLYNLRQKLVETGAISQQLWVDTQNDEVKTRLDYNIARDMLGVFYEIPSEEIDPLLERLGDKAVDIQNFGNVSDKAKMTMRSKVDGVVIERVVVPGNYYESTDVLMQIAPLEHLWVWVNVFEVDQDKVHMGQTIEIQFPFLHQTIAGKVDYVASEVSKDTRAVRIRATIPNPEGKLKSDMLVKAQLEIPPVPGYTIVPRTAMVSINGNEYVYVRKPTAAPKAGTRPADSFERRKIEVAQENTDTVVVARGLQAGEEVVAQGSLVLSQLYEDRLMTLSGAPDG